MSPRERSERRTRAFLLARSPDEGSAELEPEEARHALRVLRLGPGDPIEGHDRRGAIWPLEIQSAERGELGLRQLGPPVRVPAPGQAGSPLPWIEVASAVPRGARAEELVDRLVQLGTAAWTPVTWARSAPRARWDSGRREGTRRRERLERRALEALKQSRRAWEMELREPVTVLDLCARGAALAVLDPEAPAGLSGWLRDRRAAGDGTSERPLVILVGPEGGPDSAEREALRAAGARPFGLGPHVLRIETAAEAAAAIAVEALWGAV